MVLDFRLIAIAFERNFCSQL